MMDQEMGEEEPAGLEDIIEVIKQLMEMKKPQGRMNFEEFKRLKGWF